MIHPKSMLPALVLAAACCATIKSSGQGSAFTYQGRLVSGGAPANGLFTFTFSVFGVDSGGETLAGPVTSSALQVSNGLFAVALDFGAGVFSGGQRWLEIGAATNGSASFTTLSPRQELTSTPYAIQAANAGSVAAVNVSGTLSASQLPLGAFIGSLSGIGSNTTIRGVFVAGDVAEKYNWMVASNGILAIPAFNVGDGLSPPAIVFYNTNGSVTGDIWSWANHGGAGVPELLIESQTTISLRSGQNAQYDGYGAQGGVPWGAQGYATLFYMQKESAGDEPAYDGFDLPHSTRLEFPSPAPRGRGQEATPGIVGFSDTNAISPAGYAGSMGGLRFYTVLPEKYNAFPGYADTPGILILEVWTNSVTVKGEALVSGSITPTNGLIMTSNSYPITSWSALGNCGCIFWMSNATLFVICTNSMMGSAITNKVAGF